MQDEAHAKPASCAACLRQTARTLIGGLMLYGNLQDSPAADQRNRRGLPRLYDAGAKSVPRFRDYAKTGKTHMRLARL